VSVCGIGGMIRMAKAKGQLLSWKHDVLERKVSVD
jgi:hypothetical protein